MSGSICSLQLLSLSGVWFGALWHDGTRRGSGMSQTGEDSLLRTIMIITAHQEAPQHECMFLAMYVLKVVCNHQGHRLNSRLSYTVTQHSMVIALQILKSVLLMYSTPISTVLTCQVNGRPVLYLCITHQLSEFKSKLDSSINDTHMIISHKRYGWYTRYYFAGFSPSIIFFLWLVKG